MNARCERPSTHLAGSGRQCAPFSPGPATHLHCAGPADAAVQLAAGLQARRGRSGVAAAGPARDLPCWGDRLGACLLAPCVLPCSWHCLSACLAPHKASAGQWCELTGGGGGGARCSCFGVAGGGQMRWPPGQGPWLASSRGGSAGGLARRPGPLGAKACRCSCRWRPGLLLLGPRCCLGSAHGREKEEHRSVELSRAPWVTVRHRFLAAGTAPRSFPLLAPLSYQSTESDAAAPGAVQCGETPTVTRAPAQPQPSRPQALLSSHPAPVQIRTAAPQPGVGSGKAAAPPAPAATAASSAPPQQQQQATPPLAEHGLKAADAEPVAAGEDRPTHRLEPLATDAALASLLERLRPLLRWSASARAWTATPDLALGPLQVACQVFAGCSPLPAHLPPRSPCLPNFPHTGTPLPRLPALRRRAGRRRGPLLHARGPGGGRSCGGGPSTGGGGHVCARPGLCAGH